jgi:hypothetical protein
LPIGNHSGATPASARSAAAIHGRAPPHTAAIASISSRKFGFANAPAHKACWPAIAAEIVLQVVLGKAHLRKILQRYADYYNKIRTDRSLGEDAPAFYLVRRVGNIASYTILGVLHHHYIRI